MELDQLNSKIAALEIGETLRLEAIEESTYHASNGFGSSAVKSYAELPAKQKAIMDGVIKFESPSMAKGSAFHCAVLEPDLFADKYISPVESIDRRTKAGKAAWAVFEEMAEGKTVLKLSDMQEILDMRDSALVQFSHFLVEGFAEVSYWKKHENGIILKARLDYQMDDLAVDLKSTADVGGFSRQAGKFKYHLQCVHYLYVTGCNEMVFLPTGNSVPYFSGQPMIYSEYSKQRAMDKWSEVITALAVSVETDVWPAYSNDLQTKELSDWEI